MNVTRRQHAAGADTSGSGDGTTSANQSQTSAALKHLEDTMTDMQHRVVRMGIKGGCILLLSAIISITFYWHIARYVFVTKHTEDVHFLKMETCPACYGNDFCDHFTNSEVTFTGLYQYPLAHRIQPSKRVFEGRRGQFNGHPVIIKSLATPRQIQEVQKILCEFSNLQGPNRCTMHEALWKRLPLGEDTLTMYDLKGTSDLFRCPSQRLVRQVKDAFRLRDPEKPRILFRNEEMSLLFTAMVNPEPLILMTFTSSNGWPFPIYHGACGRYVVVEHRGPSASELLNSAPSVRIPVAKRILDLAVRLTSSDTGFSLYLNDWDLSNFAVFPDTGTVTLVDLSNVTVVDALDVNDKSPQGQHHVTARVGSDDDATGVCMRRLSDWNLASACDLLGRTLLRDLDKESRAGQLLAKCNSPGQGDDRFKIVKDLVAALVTSSR